jgi:phage terminase large subunit-like protein
MRAGPKAEVTAPPLDLSALPPSGGARVVAFCETFLHVPKGIGARQPLRLRPWQVEIVCGLFDAPRPRQGLVSIPRGNGKSTLAAALGLYGLFADGVEGAQVLCVASDERQARIVFNAARRMIELEPLLDERCQVFQSRLYLPHTDSTLLTLPAEMGALQGYDPSLAVVDELGVVTRDVWESVSLAAGKRDTSLTLAISTPAADLDSVRRRRRLSGSGPPRRRSTARSWCGRFRPG